MYCKATFCALTCPALTVINPIDLGRETVTGEPLEHLAFDVDPAISFRETYLLPVWLRAVFTGNDWLSLLLIEYRVFRWLMAVLCIGSSDGLVQQMC